jgi:hypothetical protein
VHDSGAHTVVTGYFWHPPAPSHLPFVPHVVPPMSLHMARGSALPATTGVHLPRVAASAQLRHAPLQSVSQQRPSTQWPLSQTASPVQALPSLIFPHEPSLHRWPGSHWESPVQPTLHAPSTHRLGLQLATPGGMQAPSPSQTPGRFWRTGPAHDGARHCVSAAYFSQPPNPSHLPVVPQVIAPLSVHTARVSGLPWSMAQHVPKRPGSAHDRQPPSQATLQQTSSAQNPETHSSPEAHFEPLGFLPQLPFTHWCPVPQSPLCAHVSKQAPVAALQPYGAQMKAGAGRQRPPPSHTWAPTTAPSSQRPLPHDVPAWCLRHAPAPSHVPSSPHVIGSDAAHVFASRGFVPDGTKMHVPMAVAAEHVLHVSLQALLQHTPSMQWLLVQSVSQPQAWPSSFCPRPSTEQRRSRPPPSPPSTAATNAVPLSPPSGRWPCGPVFEHAANAAAASVNRINPPRARRAPPRPSIAALL